MRSQTTHQPTSHSLRKTVATLSHRVSANPFIKWVGGKRSALAHLMERVPEEYSRYYEPFVGGGALFFEVQPTKAVLSDINHKLISTYQVIKNNPHELIKLLKKHKIKNSKQYYYKKRVQFNKEKEVITRASLFIYLNKVGFNGLYRENKQGNFNVPYGQHKNPTIFDEENLLNVSKLLENVKIHKQSFEQIKIESGAFYYLDPPYHQTYDQYDKNKFSLEWHKKLANFCKEVDKKNALFMLSNSDIIEVRNLYRDFKIESIEVSKSISCKSSGRKKEKELIVRNYG